MVLLRSNDKRFVHAQIFYRHIFAKQKCAGEAFAKQKDVLLQVCLARMCRLKILIILVVIGIFFYNKLELKSTLSAIGIDDSSFQKMADKACGGNGFINGWKKLYPQDVYNIYKNSL